MAQSARMNPHIPTDANSKTTIYILFLYNYPQYDSKLKVKEN